jgi:hypothetical protein
MANYGSNLYADGTYGEPSFVDFDATPFNVLPIAPGQNALGWASPTGSYSHLRLVRNAYGWPVHEDDGRVLLDLNCGPAALAPKDAPENSYLDTDLQPGRIYYYSIFVLGFDETLNHSEWLRAADTTGISVGKWNYTERMLDILPEAYWSDPSDPSGRNSQLVGFLSIFGFQLDHIRSEYETLRYLHNPDKVAAALLGPLGEMFGVSYEPEIGAKQHREMVRNAVFINRRKGTSLGTNTLVSSFTGWDANVSVGVNLMLDYNDSSFEASVGRWAPMGASCTLDRRVGDGAVATYQSPQFANLQYAMMQITAIGGDATFAVGLYRPIASGIPITGGTPYTLSAYVRSATAFRSTDLRIRWFNARGEVLSDTAYGTPVTSTITGWTRAAVTGTAPAKAVYAGCIARISGTVDQEVHYLDAVQFEASASATDFQEARDIRIELTAERINEVPNPSAELNLDGWEETGVSVPVFPDTTVFPDTDLFPGLSSSSQFVRDTAVAFSGTLSDTTPSTVVGAPNGASFKLTSNDTLVRDARTVPIPVDSDTDYALSAYVYGQLYARLGIIWYDQGLLPIGDTFFGQSRDWVTGAWTRLEATDTAPENAYYARVVVEAQFTASGQDLWFDQVLFERGGEVRPYFDAGSRIR